MNHFSISAQVLAERLCERLQTLDVEVLDESAAHHGHSGANGTGAGTHFRVRVSSPLFVGRTRVMQHRLVYDALSDFIEQGLHALAIEVR